MIHQPIFIAGPPRTGTTMITGLIGMHGVWVGRARTTNYPGTNSEYAAENEDIKELLKKTALVKTGYRNWNTPLPKIPYILNGLRIKIESFIPDDIRWLLKTSWVLVFHKFFMEVYPQAKWIIPMRLLDDIIDSTNRHPSMRRRSIEQRKNFIIALMQRQEQIIRSIPNQCHRVNVYRLSMKNKTEAEKLFECIEMDINWDVFNEFIQPGLMKKGD